MLSRSPSTKSAGQRNACAAAESAGIGVACRKVDAAEPRDRRGVQCAASAGGSARRWKSPGRDCEGLRSKAAIDALCDQTLIMSIAAGTSSRVASEQRVRHAHRKRRGDQCDADDIVRDSGVRNFQRDQRTHAVADEQQRAARRWPPARRRRGRRSPRRWRAAGPRCACGRAGRAPARCSRGARSSGSAGSRRCGRAGRRAGTRSVGFAGVERAAAGVGVQARRRAGRSMSAHLLRALQRLARGRRSGRPDPRGRPTAGSCPA